MSVKDLSRGDRIIIQEVNGVETTVQIKNVYRLVQSSFDIDKWVADVEAIDGRTWTIDDSYDFYSLLQKMNDTEELLGEKIRNPSHCNSRNGIDLNECWHQQFIDEELRGAMKFIQTRYSLRAGRKENDIHNQKKLGEYANRFIGAL
ncbi:hypothetical protein [Staphylococcus epidermidis]|uniref:hypothetical protein n=1 Tax=Staphylococcus epidermidis TaxID=1282 RepID=UPI0034D7B250